MKGYKALSREMTAVYGDGMKYELGKDYVLEGKIILGRNGFHFCKNIENLEGYYQICKSRIFEIEAAGGKTVNDCTKYCASKIRLTRELSQNEIRKYFEENLNRLVNSKNVCTRAAVAAQGCGLDILVKDENWFVREAVARQGYGLDVLMKDKNALVRNAVRSYMESHPECKLNG